MSLLTIAQQVAKSVGIAVPLSIVGDTSRDGVNMLSMANEVGEELARRVDWGQLTATTTLTGDGTNKTHTMPSGFARIVRGIGMAGPTRPLTRAEWDMTAVEGVPRYFLLEGDTLVLWPYLANAQTLVATYQSLNWCSNGTAAFAADEDTSLIDEDLFAKGLEVRWRRQDGMEYADQEAEYEATLVDFAKFNDRTRM